MKRLIIVGTCFAMLSTPSFAWYCSEPSAPYCANSYGAFMDGYDFENCKRSMERYASEVEDYLDCLSRQSDDAISAYNDAVNSFNRRARSY